LRRPQTSTLSPYTTLFRSEADRIVEVMRSKLADSWRNTADGTSQKDGYVNWVWRGDSDTYHGKDTHKLDEMKTHAIIATVAYALDRKSTRLNSSHVKISYA